LFYPQNMLNIFLEKELSAQRLKNYEEIKRSVFVLKIFQLS